MTEVLVDYAEEKFLANEIQEAANLITLAKTLDPFYVNLDKYVAVYQVHAAALKKISGWAEPNWYKVLGIEDYFAPDDVIMHRFCRLGKLIDPDNNTSAAAPGAYRLISRAIETLGNSSNRSQLHRRLGLKSPKVHWREYMQRSRSQPK